MFDKKGYMNVDKKNMDEDALMEIALEAGAEDIREDNGIFEVITDPGDFEAVRNALDEGTVKYSAAEVTMLPQSTTALQGKDAELMIRLMEALDDCEDVQKVYTNADIPEELVDNL
jgi:transcriptional/translational regulatory protein YebC/TACO1